MASTNTVEGFFSMFKRGMKGVYRHCKKQHLHRYLAELNFRYNKRIAKGIDDPEHAEKLLQEVKGKRLTYQTTDRQVGAQDGHRKSSEIYQTKL
jgi:hypothetical protein